MIVEPAILRQTDQWVAVLKPPGWLTIPGRDSPKHGTPTPVLLEWVEKTLSAGKVWVVHRLDRDTSGVVLFAKTAEAHQRANEWFQRHQVKKAYDCLASNARGAPMAPVLKIKRPIEGAPSSTQVEIREIYQEGLLLRAVPITGRRHQIRIHLSEEGYPLWGDVLYRGPTEVTLGARSLPIARVALHSARLELPGGEVFEAPWPEDFAGWVKALREKGRRS